MGGFELTTPDTVAIGNGDLPEKADQARPAASRYEGVSAADRTWRHWLVGVVSFLYFTGTHMGLFVMTQYIYRRVQADMLANVTFEGAVSYCDTNSSSEASHLMAEVQKKATYYNVLFSVVIGVPAMVTSLFSGSYTDMFGRKFLMLVTMSGSFIRTLVCLIGSYTHMDLELFAIGFAFEGISGSLHCYLLASYSYVADITSRKNRSLGILANEVAFGLGNSVPTFAIGFYMQSAGFNKPLIIGLAAIAAAMLITIFILPESYPKDKRVITSTRCSTLKNALGFYFASWNYGNRWKYIVAIIALYCTMFDLIGRNSVEMLFQMNAPLCWTPSKLGLFVFLRVVLQQAFGMIFVVFLKRFNVEDINIALLGCISYAASFVLEGFSKNDVMMYMVTVVGALGLITVPMIRGIMSRMTPFDRQGALSAGISTVDAFCFTTSNVIANAVYQATVSTMAGVVFFLMSGLNLVTLGLLAVLKVRSGDSITTKQLRSSSVIVVSYVEKKPID